MALRLIIVSLIRQEWLGDMCPCAEPETPPLLRVFQVARGLGTETCLPGLFSLAPPTSLHL